MNDTQIWVVAYDVENDRRRRKLFKLLEGFGEPRQKSVFVFDGGAKAGVEGDVMRHGRRC